MYIHHVHHILHLILHLIQLILLGWMFSSWYRSNIHVEKQSAIDWLVFAEFLIAGNCHQGEQIMDTSPGKYYLYKIHQNISF